MEAARPRTQRLGINMRALGCSVQLAVAVGALALVVLPSWRDSDAPAPGVPAEDGPAARLAAQVPESPAPETPVPEVPAPERQAPESQAPETQAAPAPRIESGRSGRRARPGGGAPPPAALPPQGIIQAVGAEQPRAGRHRGLGR
ncbi:MAG: hypothetical protein R3F43_19560 [bacterium]